MTALATQRGGRRQIVLPTGIDLLQVSQKYPSNRSLQDSHLFPIVADQCSDCRETRNIQNVVDGDQKKLKGFLPTV